LFTKSSSDENSSRERSLKIDIWILIRIFKHIFWVKKSINGQKNPEENISDKSIYK